MDTDTFADVIAAQIRICEDVLIDKRREYVPEEAGHDVFHNFRVAAAMQRTTMRKALAGMMAKHSVSIYDMCLDDDYQPHEKWIEKITDHINYLLILRAMIYEETLNHDYKTQEMLKNEQQLKLQYEEKLRNQKGPFHA